jgi:hypothetical protein
MNDTIGEKGRNLITFGNRSDAQLRGFGVVVAARFNRLQDGSII